MADDSRTPSLRHPLSRRRFMALVSGSAGALALTGCGGGGTSATSTPSTPQPTTSLPALRISSPLSATVAFTVGQTFGQGDVPAGQVISAEVAEFHAAVKNRWPDGSVKFAVLSGHASVVANTTRSIALQTTATPSSAPPSVSLVHLKATGVSASIGYGSVGSASWSGSDWDAPFQTWISGAEMSSWIYRKPIGSDAHLVGWLEVRCYKSGAVEVLPWLENGYLMVAAPGERVGTASFSLGGTSRFSQSLSLLNHTRAVLATDSALTHWLDADPQVTFQHDTTYLMASRMVPNYRAATSASSPLFARLVSNYTPLAPSNFPLAMGSTGYDESIGLLPEWEVAHLTSAADPRALRAVVINGYNAGRYGIHYRDHTTQRPLAFSAHPTLVMGDGSGVTDIGSSSTNTYTPNATGGSPPQFKTSHHPSMGYMAYLLTGWHFFMEQTQFLATANYLKQSDAVRQGAKGVFQTATGSNQVRGAAWAVRTLAQASAITPDDDALHPEFVNCVNENVNWYHARYVAQPNNPQGLVEPYDDYSSGANPLESATWQDDFFTASFGLLRDIAPYSSSVATRLTQFTEWKYKAVVGRLGGSGADEFSFCHAAQYTVFYAPSDSANYTNGSGPWYRSWGAIARAMGIAQDGTAAANLTDSYFPEPTSYWGNLMPAIAYAYDHAAPGAQAAWNRLTGAANFGAIAPLFNDAPVWGIKPRGT